MVTTNTAIRMKFDMRVLCICLMLTMTSISGCLEDEPEEEIPIEEPSLPEGTFVTGANGTAIDAAFITNEEKAKLQAKVNSWKQPG